jgi:hypothetical protein
MYKNSSQVSIGRNILDINVYTVIFQHPVALVFKYMHVQLPQHAGQLGQQGAQNQ